MVPFVISLTRVWPEKQSSEGESLLAAVGENGVGVGGVGANGEGLGSIGAIGAGVGDDMSTGGEVGVSTSGVGLGTGVGESG